MKNFIGIICMIVLTVSLSAQISAKGKNMRIIVQLNSKSMVFQLNESRAAKELYVQLPLEIEIENYSDNEKIFYPPKKLSTDDAPLADAKVGTLAYYAP